ncbi:hypothetical protein IX329_001117 [Fusobacterium necrophorum]|nr:hypothetical protein FGAG_01661 [Fusobacterium gonidiaformans ATCC 25563]MBR8733543.1 hypothetical protein [Fusobacterium necrophorum]MBR8789806.1 hypothetical protein [Fusobacterium necrophorum]
MKRNEISYKERMEKAVELIKKLYLEVHNENSCGVCESVN